jgi:transcriptional regulator with GAF, ATPase, and Fis domain
MDNRAASQSQRGRFRTVSPWLLVIGTASAEAQRSLASSLADLGLDVVPLETDSAQGPGIVCFEGVSNELCEAVATLSRGRLERVVAIALGERPTRREAWRLVHAGAADIVTWDRSEVTSSTVAAHFERWEQVDEILNSPLVSSNLVGKSPAWIAALREVIEVARFSSVPVLLEGETGTGKELMASLVHALSPNVASVPHGEFVVLDCAAVPATLSSSTFFGHAKGSFTGAASSRQGAFAVADGGTLFLDEVGELAPSLQAELMRAVQEGTYKPVGSDHYRSTNFRLVCATNRDLLEDGHLQTFRRDFYYRIAGATCRIPPLRDRVQDIAPLAEYFLKELIEDGDPPALEEPVRELLVTRPYPGNVRELKHLVARIARRHVGPGPITIGDVPAEEWQSGQLQAVHWQDVTFESSIRRALDQGASLREITNAAAETAINIATSEEGTTQGASQRLGVTPRALQLRAAKQRSEQPGHGGVD